MAFPAKTTQQEH